MRIALVHDWLTNMGGSEKVLELIHQVYPEAPIYTLLYDKKRMAPSFHELDIRTSYLQKIPLARIKHQWLLRFMPAAVESLDLREYDLVISSSTSCAKGVLTRADCCHICYCNTPMRYAWDFYQDYLQSKPHLLRIFIARQLHSIRQWDRIASDRVDYFLTNSCNVKNRIHKHYGREAHIIYPPVDTEFFTPGIRQPGDYFLCAGRLVAYKKTELAVRVCSAMNVPLVVAGSGGEYRKLKTMAGSSVKFKDQVSQEELLSLYRGCRALIFPGEEDFGLTPLEAQACGRPVIAYRRGGALETVRDGEAGLFFDYQTEASLREALEKFATVEEKFDQENICRHARKFNIPRFKAELLETVSRMYGEYQIRLKDS